MRRQIIGNVSVELQDAFDVGDDAAMIEERNDRTNHVLAPHQSTTNSIQRHNIHISMEFNADANDPSERFLNITRGYESLKALEEAITESLTQVQEGP